MVSKNGIWLFTSSTRWRMQTLEREEEGRGGEMKEMDDGWIVLWRISEKRGEEGEEG